MKNIYLIRHSEKENGFFLNNERNTQDPPLNKKGIHHSKLLSKYLIKLHIQEIWSSDLLRTKETATIINKQIKVPCKYYKELREINMGEYEKLSYEKFYLKYPNFSQPYFLDENDRTYPNGECGNDVLKRVWPLIDTIQNLNIQNIAIITHGGVIRVIISHILDMDLGKRFRLGNPPATSSISQIIFESEHNRYILETFNDVHFLKK